MSPIKLFLTVVTFLILLIILSGFPLSLRRPRRPAYLPICQPPRPETYPSQVGSPVGSFLLVPSQSVQAFPFGRRYLFSSFLTGYFRPGHLSPATLFLISSAPHWPPFLPPSLSHFCRALAAFFTARPRSHATRSSSRLIAVLSPSPLVPFGLRPPSFRFSFLRRAAF